MPVNTSSRFCRHESDRPGGDASTSTSCRADTALRRGGTTLQKGPTSTSTSCRTDTALRRGGTTRQKGTTSTSTSCRTDTALRRGGAAGIGVPWKCPDQHQTSRRPPAHPATSTPAHPTASTPDHQHTSTPTHPTTHGGHIPTSCLPADPAIAGRPATLFAGDDQR